MNREVLNKTVAVENNLIVITEETLTRKDKRQLDNDLMAIQRQMDNCIDQNKRLLDEYNKLKLEETTILDMISQLSANDLEIINK